MDYLNALAEKTELPLRLLLEWAQIQPGRFYDWSKRYDKANEHNGKIPRDHWVESHEHDAIVEYFDKHPLDGYRRLTFMMLDEDVAAVSPATTYRVLSKAGRLDRWNRKPSRKGGGFVQPNGPHQHWHIDIAYLNIAGTFYYMCSILDGYSRFIVHWEIRESMKEVDVETILQRARERHPDARPRIISDNGPQFVAKDFKTFIRIAGMTHVRISPSYPQSNGKLERYHRTIKATAIRPRMPRSLAEARSLVAKFVAHYNERRLHSAVGFVTPADKLAGREKAIWAARDRKLEAARELRRQRRESARAEIEERLSHGIDVIARSRSPATVG